MPKTLWHLCFRTRRMTKILISIIVNMTFLFVLFTSPHPIRQVTVVDFHQFVICDQMKYAVQVTISLNITFNLFTFSVFTLCLHVQSQTSDHLAAS